MDSALKFRCEGWCFEAQTLPWCYFLRQEELIPHCISPPGCMNGYRGHTAGGNPAMEG